MSLLNVHLMWLRLNGVWRKTYYSHREVFHGHYMWLVEPMLLLLWHYYLPKTQTGNIGSLNVTYILRKRFGKNSACVITIFTSAHTDWLNADFFFFFDCWIHVCCLCVCVCVCVLWVPPTLLLFSTAVCQTYGVWISSLWLNMVHALGKAHMGSTPSHKSVPYAACQLMWQTRAIRSVQFGSGWLSRHFGKPRWARPNLWNFLCAARRHQTANRPTTVK